MEEKMYGPTAASQELGVTRRQIVRLCTRYWEQQDGIDAQGAILRCERTTVAGRQYYSIPESAIAEYAKHRTGPGFASMPTEKRREIAGKGGTAKARNREQREG